MKPFVDVGIVTQLSGEATYWNEGYQKTPEKAQVFMKIRLGDYFKIAAGGAIQLVYFESGRQETWKGPASFMVGEVQSRVEKGRERGREQDLKQFINTCYLWREDGPIVKESRERLESQAPSKRSSP